MVLSWKRFWVPFGSEISCGISGDGFLDDPEANLVSLNRSARHLDDLLSEPCLVLLGEPGLGKSIALEQAFPEIDHTAGGDQTTIWIRFRDIPDTSTFNRRVLDSVRWHSWLKGDHELTLVLDGLDEGLIKISNFVSFLTLELRSSPLRRLRLIAACRTADWPFAAGRQLVALWKKDPPQCIWELCPLRRTDAVLAATSNGVSIPDFFEQIFAKNVVTLAARPTTLLFLLQQFKASGQLDGTHREIYERGIVDLCREPDPERAEIDKFYDKNGQIASPEGLRDGTAFLAALLILSGRSAISLSDREDPAFEGDLYLYSVLANGKFESSANWQTVIASLNTALFSSRGENRVGFAHQTFAECLAAQKVRNLPLIQLRKLFCGIDGKDEHVIPQLAETAAWLAGINDDFLVHLLSIDPGVLLRSDVARVQGNRKVQIVRAILERTKQLELFNDFNLRRFLSGLKHSQLAQQLWEYIKDDTLNVIVRRLALEIAEECQLSELNDDLLLLLFRPDVEQQVKEAAARVLIKTLPDDRLSELEPLAQGGRVPDSNDQLKGYSLDRLVPNHWSVSRALEYMSLPKDSGFHGSYYWFLTYQAPKYIVVADLPTLLTWLLGIDQCFDILHPFCALAYRGICLALQHLEEPKIRASAIRLWRKYTYRQRSRRSDELNELWNDDSLRRTFAFYVLQHPETTNDDVAQLLFDAFPLLEGRDLGWILEELPAIGADRLPIWVQATSLLARPDDVVKCWDLFLTRITQIPILQSRFSWLRTWDVNEPAARKAKADFLRDERRRVRFERGGLTPDDTRKLIDRGLQLISEGKYWNWEFLCKNLTLEEGDVSYPPLLPHDVTTTPGWQNADVSRRILIKEAARKFLIGCSDGYETLRARSTFSDPGYLAIWLLRDEFDSNRELREAVSKNWINAIVGFFNNGEDHHQEMVALAYALNADTTIDALRREVEDCFQQHGHILAWRGFAGCWNDRLSSILAEFAISHSTKKDTLISSLCFLFEQDPSAFQKWMRRILPRIQRFTIETRATITALAHALAPAETWDLAWEMIVRDQPFGETVLLTVANNIQLEHSRKALNLAPEKLGELVKLLYKLFPPVAEVERASGFVTPRQAVADYRRSILNVLTACPDPRAGEELISLAEEFPEYEIEFRWRYRDHLKARRRGLWNPPSVTDLLDILLRPEARLIVNAGDLFEVVIESLQRFEEYYTKQELPAVERLWCWQKKGNRRTDFEPKDEEDLSNELARWLRDDIGPEAGIVIGREVQIERRMRTDILVKAVIPGNNENANELDTVVVEVKGCWNSSVKEDLENQLIQKYLLPHNWAFGIYVVGWFVCDAWKTPTDYLKSASLGAARDEVRRLADDASIRHEHLTVAGLALDCRYR
jgi:hypothetical protein